MNTLNVPPLSVNTPVFTVRLLATTVPESIWNVPPLFTNNVELLFAATFIVAPLTTNQPLSATKLPMVLFPPVNVQVPAPSLLNVPLPVNVPLKFVLAPA